MNSCQAISMLLISGVLVTGCNQGSSDHAATPTNGKQPVATASSEVVAEDLYCAGNSYFYKDGFGKGTPLKAEASRLVSLNKKTKKMAIETALGGKTTVAYLDDNKIISTEIPMNKELHGSLVSFENININQYTGKMTGIYFLADKQMFLSFEGVCKKAKKAF